jgi:hypothetical protein
VYSSEPIDIPLPSEKAETIDAVTFLDASNLQMPETAARGQFRSIRAWDYGCLNVDMAIHRLIGQLLVPLGMWKLARERTREVNS